MSNKKLILRIRAYDIETTDYVSGEDDAISLALQRATGNPDVVEAGGVIKIRNRITDIMTTPKDLLNRVLRMYRKIERTEDFTFTIEFPEEFIKRG